MNETLQQIDRISSVGQNRFQKPVNNMRLMIKKCNLIDIWRELNFNKKQFTWRRKNDKNTASRIDYFLIDKDLKQKVESTDIRPAAIKYTDDQAISIKIRLNSGKRGKGYFKLNNCILEDTNYKNCIQNLINKRTAIPYDKDPTVIWDLLKTEIREVTINYCKARAKENRNRAIRLETKLNQLHEL